MNEVLIDSLVSQVLSWPHLLKYGALKEPLMHDLVRRGRLVLPKVHKTMRSVLEIRPKLFVAEYPTSETERAADSKKKPTFDSSLIKLVV